MSTRPRIFETWLKLGRVLGFKPRHGASGTRAAPAPDRTLEPVCSVCSCCGPELYCLVHGVPLCAFCIADHQAHAAAMAIQQCDGYSVVSTAWDTSNVCRYISTAYARMLEAR
jgi:hypothetical protein